MDEDHFTLDKLLNRTEQDLQQIDKEKSELVRLLKENERLKKEMQLVLDKEKHLQEVEKLKHQNKISEDKLNYLKDMERRLKSMVIEWRRAEDKDKVVKMIHALLFNTKEKMVVDRQQKKLNEKFVEVGGSYISYKVMMKRPARRHVKNRARKWCEVWWYPTVDVKDVVVGG